MVHFSNRPEMKLHAFQISFYSRHYMGRLFVGCKRYLEPCCYTILGRLPPEEVLEL